MEASLIARILSSLLNQNNSIRAKAETEYNCIKASQPFELISELTILMNSHSEEQIQSIAAVLLKRILTERWGDLGIEQRKTIKNLLILSMTENKPLYLAKKISDVASSLSINQHRTANAEVWEELISFILHFITSDCSSQAFIAVKIFIEIFPFYSERLSSNREALYQAYLKHLGSPEAEMRLIAIQGFCSMISVISLTETKYFVGLLQSLLKAVISLATTSSFLTQEALKALRDLAETEPFFFKSRFSWAFVLAESLIKTYSDPAVQYLCLEFITTLTERLPETIKEKLQNYQQIFEIFRISFTSSIQFSAELVNKKEVEINYEENILLLLKIVIDCLRQPMIEIVFSNAAVILESSTEWKERYMMILFFLQAAFFGSNSGLFERVLELVLSNCRYQNLSVRKAGFRALSEFFLEFPKEFHVKYHERIVPTLFNGFEDPERKVACGSFKAMKEFIESSDEYLTALYLKRFLPALSHQLEKCSNLRVVLPIVQSLALFCSKKIEGFFQEFFPRIMQIFKSRVKEKVRIVALECLMTIRVTLRRSAFIKYVPLYVAVLKALEDPARHFPVSCLLDSWKILAMHLKVRFSQFLPEIIPQLLNKIHTSDPNDCEEYLESLLSIIDSCKSSYIDFVMQTSDIIIPLINKSLDDQIKILSSNIAASLIVTIKESQNEKFSKSIILYARTFIAAIWDVCRAEEDLNTLVGVISSVTTIIRAPGVEFLTADEVSEIGQIILKLLQNHASYKSTEDDDFIYEQDYLRQTTSEMLSVLFKSHTLLSIDILSYVYNNVIHAFLQVDRTDSEIAFSLSIISDILFSVGNLIDPGKLKELIEVIVTHLDRGGYRIRTAAVYGVISAAIGVSEERLCEFLKFIFLALETLINNSHPRERHSKSIVELAVIAVGFLIKYHRRALDVQVVLPWWIRFLPIKKHKVYGGELHDFLADFVIIEAPGFAKSIEILKVFLTIAFTDVCLLSTIPKISKVLSIYLQNNSKEFLFAAVDQNLRVKLNRLILS